MTICEYSIVILLCVNNAKLGAQAGVMVESSWRTQTSPLRLFDWSTQILFRTIRQCIRDIIVMIFRILDDDLWIMLRREHKLGSWSRIRGSIGWCDTNIYLFIFGWRTSLNDLNYVLKYIISEPASSTMPIISPKHACRKPNLCNREYRTPTTWSFCFETQTQVVPHKSKIDDTCGFHRTSYLV